MARPAKNLLRPDDRAEVGIGTMIVFIATILVAAVAAGVLISTSQKLQSKAFQTGNEAIANVASSLDVRGVDGLRSGTTPTDLVDQFDLTVTLNAGADPVDLSTITIIYNDGNNLFNLVTCNPGGSVAVASTQFATTVIRGSGGDCGVVGPGDLVIVHLGLAGAAPVPIVAGGVASHTSIQLQVLPRAGVPGVLYFTVPEFQQNVFVNVI